MLRACQTLVFEYYGAASINNVSWTPKSTGFQAYLAGGRKVLRQRTPFSVVAAKKGGGGGKKGGGGPKGASLIPKSAGPAPYQDAEVLMNNLLLVESFARQVGSPMLEDADISQIGRLLWEAPFGLISHDRFAAEEGQAAAGIQYANKVALEMLEAEWGQVVGSSIANFLADAAEQDGLCFNATLKSTSDKKFVLQNATVWKVEAPSGNILGEAVRFDHWRYADGSTAGPGVPAVEGKPTEEDIRAAETAVSEQGALVRALKEVQGLTNEDPEVQDAVALLLKRKQRVQDLKAALDAVAQAEAVVQADV